MGAAYIIALRGSSRDRMTPFSAFGHYGNCVFWRALPVPGM
jgi:hypothetical protein